MSCDASLPIWLNTKGDDVTLRDGYAKFVSEPRPVRNKSQELEPLL